MPVCARCEGIIIGFILALVGIYIGRFKALSTALMLVPLIIDGAIQRLTNYESNNWIRLITGILFGYAATTLIIISVAATFNWGYNTGLSMIE